MISFVNIWRMKLATAGTVAALFILFNGDLLAQPDKNTMPIDLETVLKLSGTDNLRIAEIKAKYELAKAKQLSSKEWFLPTVSPGLLLMGYDGNAQLIDGAFIDINTNSFWGGFGVSANWDLGENVYNYLASKQELESAGFANQVIQNEATLDAVTLFFNLGAAQSKVAALDLVMVKAEDIVRQIELLVINGSRYKSDVLLAKANLNHIKIEISRAKEKVRTNSNELLKVLNIKDQVLLLIGDSILVPVDLVDTSSANLNTAYEKRPEVHFSKSNLEALTIRRKATTTGLLLPNISFGLNDGLYGPYFNPLANRFSYYFGAKWDIPLVALFYGGDKKQFDVKIGIEDIKLEGVKNTIRQEVMDAQAKVEGANEQMRLAQASTKYARDALDQCMKRQELGIGLPLEVFQAQEQLLKANIDLINSISRYNKAQYILYVALGNNF